jgi:hypothetical protein
MLRIKIGADPELFAKVGGSFISVHDLMPGTKWAPFHVPRGAVQVDGVSAEFNIEPARTRKEFLRNIKVVRHGMLKLLQEKSPSLELVASPTATFDSMYFKELPEFALELGCQPDYSAYTRLPNEKPHTDKPMRTGSGHVHIGWDGVHLKTEEHLINLVKDLDFALAPQALNWDTDKERMELYGSLGSFRPKEYGLEYRVLSNSWLQSDKTIGFVFDVTKKVAEHSLTKEPLHQSAENSTEDYEVFLKKNGIPVFKEYIIGAE